MSIPAAKLLESDARTTYHRVASALHERPGFRRDIEGLRGIAVLAVVLFHAGVPGFSGGFVGVDVFFVLSGYLITGLLLAERERTGTVGFGRFYARRIRRLLPAAILMIVVTCIAGSILYSPLEQLRYASAAAATTAYASNFWFVVKAADYFSPSVATNPFLHMWSLAVEEQFYLVWPLLIVVGYWRARSRARLVTTLGLVTAVSFFLCTWITGYRSTWAFFLMPTRAWEFGAGGLLALLPVASFGDRDRSIAFLGWLGAAALILAIVFFSPATEFPGFSALMPVAGTIGLLLPGHLRRLDGVAQRLHAPFWQHLGRLSYSWYLWHWPAILMIVVLWPSSILLRMLAGAGALGLAFLTYRFVERPIRDISSLATKPSRAFSLAGAFTAAGLLAAFMWTGAARLELARDPQRAYFEAANSTSVLDSRACIPKPTDATLRECLIGSRSSNSTLVAIGDSHLSHWYPALDSLGKALNARVLTLIKPGCPTPDIPIFNERLGREYRECQEWRQAAVVRVRGIRPIGIILATSHNFHTNATDLPTAFQWKVGFLRTIGAWDSAGLRTVIIRDTPWLRVSAPECLSAASFRKWYSLSACTTPRISAVDTVQFNGARAAIAELRNAQLVDFTSEICPGAECRSMAGNLVVYKDNSHLNSAFVRSFIPVFIARMNVLLRSHDGSR